MLGWLPSAVDGLKSTSIRPFEERFSHASDAFASVEVRLLEDADSISPIGVGVAGTWDFAVVEPAGLRVEGWKVGNDLDAPQITEVGNGLETLGVEPPTVERRVVNVSPGRRGKDDKAVRLQHTRELESRDPEEGYVLEHLSAHHHVNRVVVERQPVWSIENDVYVQAGLDIDADISTAVEVEELPMAQRMAGDLPRSDVEDRQRDVLRDIGVNEFSCGSKRGPMHQFDTNVAGKPDNDLRRGCRPRVPPELACPREGRRWVTGCPSPVRRRPR